MGCYDGNEEFSTGVDAATESNAGLANAYITLGLYNMKINVTNSN